MADNKNPQTGGLQSQAQSASPEKDFKKANAPEPKADEPVFFDTTIAKLVKRENEDGEEEWVEVLSDNLYPGERLKREVDEEKAQEKLDREKAERDAAAKDKK